MEFPAVLTRRECEAITKYFATESDFIVRDNFYNIPRNRNLIIRTLAVSIIARHSRALEPDAYVPYIAMNYFDRYFSRHLLPNVAEEDYYKTLVLAISCLTIAAKMRTKSFSTEKFLKDTYVQLSHEQIRKMELGILNGLNWRMRPVTPFCFLDHYYPLFRRVGGFRRRCINEIIVQSQGEATFTQYKPSQIALATFLAATRLAYPSKFADTEKPEEVRRCMDDMIEFCRKLRIQVEVPPTAPIPIPRGRSHKAVVAYNEASEEEETETLRPRRRRAVVEDTSDSEGTAGSETETTQQRLGKALVEGTSEESSADEAELEKRRRAKGKAVVGANEEEEEEGKWGGSILEIVPASEVVPKKLMNFDLRWPLTDPCFQLKPGYESRMVSLRAPQNVQGPGAPVLRRSFINLCGCNIG